MTHRILGRAPLSLFAAGALVIAATASAQEKRTGSPARPELVEGRAPGSWFDGLTTSVLPLSLADAVQRAVENNPDLAIVRLGTEIEAARVGESRGAFAPVFSTTVGRSNNVTPPSNFLLGDQGVNIGDSFWSTGVRQRLPFGGGTCGRDREIGS